MFKNKVKKIILDGVNFSIIFVIAYLIVVPVYPFIYAATINSTKEVVEESTPDNNLVIESKTKTIDLEGKTENNKEEVLLSDEDVKTEVDEEEILSGLNSLKISKIGVAGDIVVTDDEKEGLDNGFWMYPTSVSPGNGGNFILSGHRYKYLPPYSTTFYNLDKMNKNDEIVVEWKGVIYKYIVKKVEVVEDNDRKVVEQVDNKIITLITCHPLFTSEKRLIVVGELLEKDSDKDGLFDSDEVYKYQTDPKNPDTDGDGYIDGIEIENGYNPLGEGRL